MSQRASALVTLLFTDLVGSTELLSRAGDEEAQRIFRARMLLQRNRPDDGQRAHGLLGSALDTASHLSLGGVAHDARQLNRGSL